MLGAQWSQWAPGIASPAPSWKGHGAGHHYPGFPASGAMTPQTPATIRSDPFSNYKAAIASQQRPQQPGAPSSDRSSGYFPHLPSTGSNTSLRRRQVFKSHLLVEGSEIQKPWLENKQRKNADRKAYWLFVIACIIGIIAAAGVVYTGIMAVPKHTYCLMMQDDFSGTELNKNVWFHEQQTGGFGNGEFEWTTDSTNNSYVRDGYLYITPTLTSDSVGEAAIINGGQLNLTTSGTCTAANISDAASCSVASNSSTGVILPPIQSARIITNFSTTIKYGRVEIKAKMPTGDWIWPALWMMPKDSVYGDWPRSGEIDIFESKGNRVTTKDADASNRMHSSMHWGLTTDTYRYKLTTDDRQLYRGFYDQEFHTFGLEWTPEGIYTWEGSPVHKVLEYKWDVDFYHKGKFPLTTNNGTDMSNPWPVSNGKGAPFDQEFFLILSVAVGGTNRYFNDLDQPAMPWSNEADNPRAQFWAAKDQWLPTWPQDPAERSMIIDSVKMYQLQGPEGKACPAQPVVA